jgi:dihydrofolate synthase/folylpolyglutamate synthase
VIEARARVLGAPLFRQGIEWEAEPRGDGGLAYRGKATFDLPPPGLAGPHQYDNAGTALACLDWAAGLEPPVAALARGIGAVEWPARLQRLAAGSLAQLLPAGGELWLDGAHNAAGGAALGAMAETWRDKPLRLVFGMLKTHDARTFLSSLAPFAAGLEAVAIPGEANSLSAAEAAEAARAAGIAAREQPSIRAAVQAAALPQSRVLICGSLYLAGRVLAENGTPA